MPELYQGSPHDSHEATRLQEKLDAITKMHVVYQAKKPENLDLICEQVAKHERELLLRQENETLGFELNKKGITSESAGSSISINPIKTNMSSGVCSARQRA
ncbi:MAG: hypothetical protein EZS28_032154 [Streblomastix strix]|uniref:Uncharacterized protein n=1 Tax=Streblomastix strix TaxID=222440 RepID=A0A5J4UPC6_9EUKA|nr:MAG: hypothetical protein EZS28_032154 [Streblomastix strix]